jgi:hypothetical protein
MYGFEHSILPKYPPFLSHLHGPNQLPGWCGLRSMRLCPSLNSSGKTSSLIERGVESPGLPGPCWLPAAVSHLNILFISWSLTNIDKNLWFARPGTRSQWIKWKMRHGVCPQKYNRAGVERHKNRYFYYKKIEVKAECCGHMRRALSQIGDSGRRSEGGDPWNESSSMSEL